MNATKKVLSPGVLYTDYGRYRLIKTATVVRDDQPYKCYNTFMVTPENDSSEANEVHVPEYALTCADRFQINWTPRWIEVAIPAEFDEDFRLYCDDEVVVDQEPACAMPEYDEYDAAMDQAVENIREY